MVQTLCPQPPLKLGNLKNTAKQQSRRRPASMPGLHCDQLSASTYRPLLPPSAGDQPCASQEVRGRSSPRLCCSRRGGWRRPGQDVDRPSPVCEVSLPAAAHLPRDPSQCSEDGRQAWGAEGRRPEARAPGALGAQDGSDLLQLAPGRPKAAALRFLCVPASRTRAVPSNVPPLRMLQRGQSWSSHRPSQAWPALALRWASAHLVSETCTGDSAHAP